jgi:hypothetical protein
MTDGLNAIAKAYDLLRWLLPTVSKFPKDKRYTLGQRIENKLLDILNLGSGYCVPSKKVLKVSRLLPIWGRKHLTPLL